jgi:hypothetical protein
MQAFVVFRSSMFDERQWRMFSISGLLIAATTAFIGLIDTGIERVLLLVTAASLFAVIGLLHINRSRGKVEEISIGEGLLVRVRKTLTGRQTLRQEVASIVSYSFVAYDDRALESRIDAWFRRANRQPDGREYQTLVLDSGGLIWKRRQDFRLAAALDLSTWELKLVFTGGEAWTWRYRSMAKKDRLAMAGFLEALARA